MIKDFLISFKDNIKSKTSNPFLGTYAIVWVIRNWRLVYSLFHFDDKTTLDSRLKIISSYYSENSFIGDLFKNILWAIALLIITYLLMNLSRLIVNFSEKKLTPWVYKITDKNSVVLKIDNDRVKEEKEELANDLERERGVKRKLQNEIKNLEEQIEEIFRANAEREGEESLEMGVEKNKALPPEEILYQKVKEKKLQDILINLALAIQGSGVNGAWVESGGNVKYFLRIGVLLSKERKTDKNQDFCVLSDLGEKVFRKLQLEAD